MPDIFSFAYPLTRMVSEQALIQAVQYCQAHAKELALARRPQLELLRRDIEAWQEARIRWVERSETAHPQATAQLVLFEEKEERDRRRARRAAETRLQHDLEYQKNLIQMRCEQRKAEIVAMEQIDSVLPQAIGALVMVPAEEC